VNSSEILSIHHVKHQKGDGISFTIDSNRYQLVYVKESCLYKVKVRKEFDDRIKIIKNLKNLLLDIIKDWMKKRKLIIPEMKVFGITNIKLNIHLYTFGLTDR